MKYFLEHGYRVDAVDGSAKLCRIASEFTGIQVHQMLFQELQEKEMYDGIWACASVLHVPKIELANILQKMCNAVKVGGIIYTSLKASEVGDFFVISQKKFRRICEKYLGIVHRENVDNQ